MQIRPRLVDWDNLSGPQWIEAELSESELDELLEATVMFLGHHPASPGRAVVLGSGVIVGVTDTIIVATASHIFTWWADQIRPSAPHPLRGVTGDREDVMRRVKEIVMQDCIVAGVTPMGALGGVMLPIVGLAINSDPRELDVGFVQLKLPSRTDRSNFRVLPIDADHISFRDPILLAGYVGGGREYPNGEGPFDAGIYEQKIAVRAGRIGDLVKDPEGHRSPMYRVNIPSLPGMSGGPLMVLRPTVSEGLSIVTTAGVISSSRLGSPFLLNHCEEGETWVSPIVLGLGRKLTINGQSITVSDAIDNKSMPSFGVRASKIDVVRDETDGVARATFRERTKHLGN